MASRARPVVPDRRTAKQANRPGATEGGRSTRGKAIALVVVLALAVVTLAAASASAGTKSSVCDNNIYVKHMQMGGGDAARCLACHASKKDAMPGELRGKYANMGAPTTGARTATTKAARLYRCRCRGAPTRAPIVIPASS